jgi:hypothetical protein
LSFDYKFRALHNIPQKFGSKIKINKSLGQEVTRKRFFWGGRRAAAIGCPLLLSTIIFTQQEKEARERGPKKWFDGVDSVPCHKMPKMQQKAAKCHKF